MAQEDIDNSKYLPELMAEKDSIEPIYEHAARLIKAEIERITNPKPTTSEMSKKDSSKKDLLDVTSGRNQKVECDVLVPADKHPHVNFVGRLIGPGGSTMKGIQELTSTRIAVLGKGSVRQSEREKAEELKDKDEKYAHLNYPLHVHISAVGPVPQAFVNLGRAVAEIQKLIVIDESSEYPQGQGMGGGMRGRGMRGRGGGGGPGRGFQRGGRGGMQRGGAGGRGNAQGARGSTRGGRGRGAGRGQPQQFSQMQQSEGYGEDFGYDAYGGGGGATGFEQSGFEGYDESYDASYGADGGYGDASYGEDYSYGQESYDSYGNGASTGTGGNYGGQASFRGKMRGGARGRQKPY